METCYAKKNWRMPKELYLGSSILENGCLEKILCILQRPNLFSQPQALVTPILLQPSFERSNV